MKKFYNYIAIVMVALVGLSIAACSDDDYNTNPYSKSGVNLLAFGPSPSLRNTEIRITGTNMNKVDKVIFPADATVEEAAVLKENFNSSDNENIYLNIPDATVPGKIKLVAGNDTIVSEGTLAFEEPIEVTSVTPVKGLNAGDYITIKGDYVYNIASVTFTSGVVVTAEEFKSSRREVQVPVPLAAESGTIMMSDGNEWELEWEEPLEILSATATAVSKTACEFGDEITISGTNLHTVETVMFPGAVSSDFTVSADNKTITTTVPAECKGGAITLVLYSGNAITSPEISVPSISITNVSKTSDICVEDEIIITGENLNRVKSMSLPGIEGDVQFELVDNNTIKFVVPEGFVDGNIVLVQNSNISVSQAVAIRKLAGVLWQGKVGLVGWGNNFCVNKDNQSELFAKMCETITTPGQLTIHFKQTKEGPAFQCRMSDWNTPFANPSITPESDGVYKPAAGVEDLVLSLSEEEVAQMFTPGGMGLLLWGDGVEIQYVKWVGAADEVVIWEGNESLDGGAQPFIGTDTTQGESEFVTYNVQEGNKLRFYLDTTGDNWWIQIFEGHWTKPNGTDPVLYGQFGGPSNGQDGIEPCDIDALGGCVTITVTQEMIDYALKGQWWGGIFVCQGAACSIKSITVAPL